jgi:23S rRNA (pseudouridine1915-N3)-methyltransferase
MDVRLLAIGRLKAGAERDLCERYLDRARKSGARLGFGVFSVKEIAESRAPRSEDRMSEEADALARAIGGEGPLVCLDAPGEPQTSETFARQLRRDADAAVSQTTFVIGGADGLGPGILARADRCLSLGRMTWPHQLARVLLAEQLYRAMTILSGHPYHRA